MSFQKAVNTMEKIQSFAFIRTHKKSPVKYSAIEIKISSNTTDFSERRLNEVQNNKKKLFRIEIHKLLKGSHNLDMFRR